MKTDRARLSLRRGSAAAVALLLGTLAAVAFLQPKVVRHSQFVRCVSPLALWGDLDSNPEKQLVAQMIVGSAENSSLYWEDQVGFLRYNVENSDQWNRGYTGGIIGFTSKTASMLELVRRYVATQPDDNPLAPFLPALEAVNGTSSSAGLGPAYEQAWKIAAEDPLFLDTQLELAHEWYFAPALEQARGDGLGAFGQFAYYDAMIQHGAAGFDTIHRTADGRASPPSRDGDEKEWLQAFLAARKEYMIREVSAATASRVTTAQQGLLEAGEFDLAAPLAWDIYGDHFRIGVAPFCGRA